MAKQGIYSCGVLGKTIRSTIYTLKRVREIIVNNHNKQVAVLAMQKEKPFYLCFYRTRNICESLMKFEKNSENHTRSPEFFPVIL